MRRLLLHYCKSGCVLLFCQSVSIGEVSPLTEHIVAAQKTWFYLDANIDNQAEDGENDKRDR